MASERVKTVGGARRVFFAGLAIIVLLAGALVFLHQQGRRRDFLTAEQRNWLDAHVGKIDVLLGFDAPPDAFHNEKGEYVGLWMDYLEVIERELDFEFVFHNFNTWDELIEYSKVHDKFIIPSISETTGRKEYLTFTESITRIPNVVVTRTSMPDLKMEDLIGLDVATMENSVIRAYMDENWPQVRCHDVTEDIEGLQCVSTGKYDAMVVNQLYATYLVEKNGIANLKITCETDHPSIQHIATSIKDPILRQILDRTLMQISPQEKERILRRWLYLGQNRIDQLRAILPVLLMILSLVLAMILGVILWNYTLTRQIRLRTRELSEEIAVRKKAQLQRENAIKALQRKNEELESIVYISSHDLRSPLVNIRGFAGEMKMDHRRLYDVLRTQQFSPEVQSQLEELRESSLEAMNFIETNAEKMDRLLEGLASISQTSTATFDYECLDMNTLVQDVVNSLQNSLATIGGKVTIETLCSCRGDSMGIRQVFFNLIDNAIKYRHPNRLLEVRIYAEHNDRYCTYCIEDNGIGIKPQYQEKIFRTFHQLEPAGSGGGIGLGLTIVKQIVDKMNGQIILTSEPDKGTTFAFSLPCFDCDTESPTDDSD